ncbi:hypothetical protein HDE_14411 [Halotydeus destructor]|nr:hypothetical protein HDE_14411 [Halotydeus destructor]
MIPIVQQHLNPKKPYYSTYRSRINTYRGNISPIDAKQLAASGFYCTNGIVECHHCCLILRDLDEESQHLKLKPDCLFAKLYCSRKQPFDYLSDDVIDHGTVFKKA